MSFMSPGSGRARATGTRAASRVDRADRTTQPCGLSGGRCRPVWSTAVTLLAVLVVLFMAPSPAAAGQRWEHPLPGARVGQCYSGFHRGVDMFQSHKHRVVAARRGKVVYAGWNDGYGRLVVVVHGSFYTAYGHLNAIKVRKGQWVRAGQGLGWQGQTGDATASHLHFEVWAHGWYRKVNPAPFMRNRGVRLGWCR
jgi:murein DD-endopeptidase MepM/ murein hydrolase activator NlpD